MNGLNILSLISLFTAALFYGIGSLLARDKIGPNYFMGFRTRKTLKDRDAWYRTNRAAGTMMRLLAIPTALTAAILPFFPMNAQVPIFVTVLYGGLFIMIVVSLRAQNDPNLPGAPPSPAEAPPSSSPKRNMPVR